jgi:AcrR family transcriptional regulator
MSEATTSEDVRSDGDLRRQIMDAARHLLIENGYKQLSMRKIADAVGYSATSIYLHFDSKDSLFHALIDEGMDMLYGELSRVRERHPDDALARLRAHGERYVRFGLNNPEYYEIMFMLHPEHMERYPARKYRRARRNLDLLAEALEDCAREGVLELTGDPRVLASTTWAALHGAISLLIARRVDVRIDRDTFTQAAVTQALRGVNDGALPGRQPVQT